MGKFFDWVRDGGPKEDFGVKLPENPEAAAEKTDSLWAETEEEKKAALLAKKEWEKREQEAFEAFVPKGPEFKIVQVPAGYFVIKRRHTQRVSRYSMAGPKRTFLGDYVRIRTAKFWEELTCAPYDTYETVKNTEAPIMVKNYIAYSQYGNYSLSGYAPLTFNIFEEAEAYLFRMAQPQDHEVGYDFPPLKRRVNKKKVATK